MIKEAKTGTDRILWMEGLRGVLVIWIVLYHYIIAFINTGFIGYLSNYAKEEHVDVYVKNFPFSIFINSNYALYVFLVMIALIPAYKFFGDRSEDSIRRQAYTRYFRLMIPTFIACIIIFALHYAGLLYNTQLSEQTGVLWLTCFPGEGGFTLKRLFYDGLVKAYVSGTSILSVTWVMGYIFLGSYLTYAILLLFGRVKNRMPFYIGIFIVLFVFDQIYISFLMGIIAADIIRKIQNGTIPSPRPFVFGIMTVLGFSAFAVNSLFCRIGSGRKLCFLSAQLCF